MREIRLNPQIFENVLEGIYSQYDKDVILKPSEIKFLKNKNDDYIAEINVETYVLSPEAPSPARLDREFLRFALCHPEYMESLRLIGLGEALRTQRGSQLWSKLLKYGVDAVQPHLDEGEKQFFIQCRFSEGSQEDPETMWQDLQARVRELRQKKRYSELQEALSRAQSQGDRQEMNRILQQISQWTKGGE